MLSYPYCYIVKDAFSVKGRGRQRIHNFTLKSQIYSFANGAMTTITGSDKYPVFAYFSHSERIVLVYGKIGRIAYGQEPCLDSV